MPSTARLVFVSSTWLDLQPERRAVLELTLRMKGLQFLGMEHFGAHSETTEQVSLQEAARGDLYVGVIAGRYGSGITELEYDVARDRGLPCLIYFKRERPADAAAGDEPPASRQRLEAFRARLRSAHTCVEFEHADELAARLSADLHNWLFERHLAQGLARLSSDFLARVQAFVGEYLGAPEQPVPFGGRAADLAQLDAWLADPAAPPYLLLSAGAGRGKSALLVRWTQSLLPRDDVVPLFFPVSVRFRTNLANVIFASLSAYLAALHGEVLAINPDTPPEVWRGRLTELLLRPLSDGRRLLLVLDGLDEAADWEAGPDLFPPQLARHARVVVSARPLAGDADAGDWLRRLGWDQGRRARTLSLAGLSEHGVAEVLEHLPLPPSAAGTRTELVHELHRLSEGDPLLVRLYADDLVGRAEQGGAPGSADLRHVAPGLDGFFTRWWDDQRRLWGSARPQDERRTQALLDLLANAFGPLRRDDLLALAPPELGLDSWALAQTLEPLRRFIVGNGTQQGFVFGHPRLGIHFRGRLSRAECERLDERFIRWGEESIAGAEARPGSEGGLPAYLVQYLGAHLDRHGAPAQRWRPLLGDAWRRAWLAPEGSNAGYRGDLDRVLRALARAGDDAGDASALALRVRCCLCVASVDEIARRTPVELIASLVRQQVWGPHGAMSYARAIADPRRRAEALVYLAGSESGAAASLALHEAIEALRAWPPGDADGDTARAALLGRMAGILPEGALPAALELALSLDRRSCMVDATLALLPRLSAAPWTRLMAAARGLEDVALRLRLLRGLAGARPEAVVALAADAGLEAWEKAWLLVAASDALAGSARQSALAAAQVVADALLADAGAAPEPADLDLHLALWSRLDGPPEPARAARLLDAAGRVVHLATRLRLLGELSACVPSPLRDRALASALEALGGTRAGPARSAALQALAPWLGPPEAAAGLDLALAIVDEGDRGRALAALLPRLGAPAREQGLAALHRIADPAARSEALVSVADLLPPGQRDELARFICFEAELGAAWVYRALCRLGPLLSEAGKAALLDDRHNYLHFAEEDSTPLLRAAALVPGLPAHLQPDATRAVLCELSTSWLPTDLAWLSDWAGAAGQRAVEQVADALTAPQPSRRDAWSAPDKRRCLLMLAPHLGRAMLERVVQALQGISDAGSDGATALVELGLETMTAAQALERHAAVWSALGPDARARLLVHWWRRGDAGAPALEAVFAQVQQMSSSDARAQALRVIVAHGGEAVADRLAAGILAAPAADERVSKPETLSLLAGSVSRALLVEHFPAFFAAGLAARRSARALHAELAERVPPALWRAAFVDACRAHAPATAGEGVRSDALAALARLAWCQDGPRRRPLEAALWAAVRMLPEHFRAALLLDLCRDDDLPAGTHAALRERVAEITDPVLRVAATILLLPRLTGSARPAVLAQGLAGVIALSDAERTRLLSMLPGTWPDSDSALAWHQALQDRGRATTAAAAADALAPGNVPAPRPATRPPQRFPWPAETTTAPQADSRAALMARLARALPGDPAWGAEAAEQIMFALHDVRRWWP